MSVEAEFERLRSLLFSIAYRMIGRVSVAEELVQETLLRLHDVERSGEQIQSQRALATTIVTRLAIDHLRREGHRREQYVGEWLPEPIVSDPHVEPDLHSELADSISMAVLVMLERLTPAERATLLLHDVFGFEFAEIAETIDKSEENVRQIAVRARRAAESGRKRFRASRERQWEIADAFLRAAEDGDLDHLVGLLSADVMVVGDGGGKVATRRESTIGETPAARLLINLFRSFRRLGLSAGLATVNAQPGVVVLDRRSRAVVVMELEIAEAEVCAVRAVVNPDKLTHLAVPPR